MQEKIQNQSMSDSSTKQSLYTHCQNHINDRISLLEKQLQSLKEARDNETKSSAGDKFETGRAMMQSEVQKIQSQLQQARLIS